MSTAAIATPPARPLVVAGAEVGLTCAAALHGWMVQMDAGESEFHWYGTFALLLAPGTGRSRPPRQRPRSDALQV
jgi:hypothetical protein